MPVQHILLATDGSGSVQRTTEVATRLAHASGGKLSILTVAGNVTKGLERFAGSEGSHADVIGFAASFFIRLRESRRKPVYRLTSRKTGWGDPAEVIIEIARHEKVDAIVARRRGHGRLAGLPLAAFRRSW